MQQEKDFFRILINTIKSTYYPSFLN